MTSALITMCVTACGRHDLLQKTLDSFFKLATGHELRVLVSEDMGTPDQCEGLIARYGPRITVFRNEPRLGQVGAIDMLYARVQTPYVFHCEDDWLFENNAHFLEESIDVLEYDQLVHQVWLREHNGKSCVGHPLGDVSKTPKAAQYRRVELRGDGWCGFSWNPGLRRMTDYRRMFPDGFSAFKRHRDPAGPYENSGEVERRCSVHAQRLGYRAAILEHPTCRHIGVPATDHKA